MSLPRLVSLQRQIWNIGIGSILPTTTTLLGVNSLVPKLLIVPSHRLTLAVSVDCIYSPLAARLILFHKLESYSGFHAAVEQKQKPSTLEESISFYYAPNSFQFPVLFLDVETLTDRLPKQRRVATHIPPKPVKNIASP